MKNLRTKVLGLFTAVLSLGSLASCGGSNEYATFEIPEGGFDTTKEVEITFYSTMSAANLVPVLETALKQFKVLYPNITVNHSELGGYDDVRNQIATEIAVGQQPDLAYAYADHIALYRKAKAVVALDNLMNDSKLGLTADQLNDFIPGYLAEGKVFGDGKMYSLPFSKSTEVLYYNETFFAANNLKLPTHWFSTGDTDDTSMEYVCAKIKELDPTSVPLGYDSEANWFITMCEQMNIPYTTAEGSKHFLFDNKEAKDLLVKLQGWYKKGWVTTQKLYGSYTSGLFVNQTAGEPKSYMSIGSSAGATHQRPTKTADGYPFSVGIAEIPQADTANKKVISQGPSVCIFNKGDAQKVMASWLLLKFLTTDFEFQANFADASGYVPVIKSVTKQADFKANLDAADGGDHVAYRSMKVCLGQVDSYFTSPAFIGSSTARDQVGDLLSAVISDTAGEKDINKLFKDAIAECEYQAA